MPDSRQSGTLSVAVVTLAALVAGVWVALAYLRPPPNAPAPPPRAEAPADSTLPGDIVDQALDLAADSVAIKHRWVDAIKELNLAKLSAPRREVFIRFANARACTCGCGYTLAGCRVHDSTCEISGPLVRALYDSVLAGRITRAEGIRERPAPH